MGDEYRAPNNKTDEGKTFVLLLPSFFLSLWLNRIRASLNDDNFYFILNLGQRSAE
jgi:hypothetical protein